MPLNIIRNNITHLRVDAIVNAANPLLKMGGGVCGAIFLAAGVEKLKAACDALSPIRTGEAVITPAYELSYKIKHIIHTAGPVYKDGKHGEAELLRACYRNALTLALENDCQSIAFPLISGGIFGYPKDEALSIATSTIGAWLLHHDMDVTLVVFDKEAFVLSQRLQSDVKEFITEYYVGARRDRERRDFEQLQKVLSEEQQYLSEDTDALCENVIAPSQQAAPFDFSLDEPFSVVLMRLIKEKGKTNAEVYKAANLDRRLFSKCLRAEHRPAKKTVVALAIALKLSSDETRDFLSCAGFALSRSVLFDVIIEYFIRHKKYDIFEINNVLFKYDQPILSN